MAYWVGNVRLPYTLDVESYGPYAYVADSYRDLNVIDIADPGRARIVRQIDTESSARQVQRLGETLFVRNGSAILIFGLSTPSDPLLLGSVEPEGPPMGFAVAGDLLHLATWDGFFHVVDVSLPSAPLFLASMPSEHTVKQVAVSGAHVYLADRSLQVVDVSDPTQPLTVGELDLPHAADGLAPADSLLYVAGGGGGVVVVRVSDPTDPRVAGITPVPSETQDVLVVGSGLLAADADWGVQVFDRSDPVDLRPLTAFDTAVRAQAVAITPTLILAADLHGGLQIIDPTRSTATSLVGFSEPKYANDVKVQNDVAYVADETSGLVTLDVSVPATPVELGRLDDFWGGHVISVVDNLAYLGAYNLVVTVDVSDPSAPERLGQIALRGGVGDIVVRDGLAYVALGYSPEQACAGVGDGLSIVVISIPAAPVEIGFLQISSDGMGLDVQGVVAYLVGWRAGVHTIDVSDPYAPALLGRYDVGDDWAYDVAVDGGYAYVGYGSRGFEVLDVRDPRQPRSVALLDTPGAARAVRLQGGLAYVADLDWGVRLIDLRLPERPVDLGMQDFPGWAEALDVAGDHVYLATSSDGLVVAERQCDLILKHLDNARAGHATAPLR